jgi:predicted kinase
MKTVIEMARQSGYGDHMSVLHAPALERFANLVRADEREVCAKVLDEMAEDMEREMEPSTAIAYVRSKAATIRARGETK